MRNRRFFRFVSHLVTMLLLAWTAACMVNPELCALDQEGLQFSGGLSADATETTTPWPSEDEVHVDDCFCCSHHIEPGFGFRVPEMMQPHEQAVFSPSGRPHAVPASLFRPPQLPV